jgi:hypothetical protein
MPALLSRRTIVLLLVLIFVVLFATLAALLFIQGYIYSEPVEQLSWRAPVAAAVLTAFLALWALLDYSAIDPNQAEIPYDTVFRFNPTETYAVKEFWSIKKEDGGEKKTRFVQRGSGEYYDEQGRPWQRSDTQGIVAAIVVNEKGQEMRFEPQLARDGKFKTGSEAFPGYFQVKGRRSMIYLGQVSVFRWGVFLGNLLLNLLHLGVWFVCLWLILRFQWSHALGLSVILWLVMTLTVMPVLLAKTYEAARQRVTGPATA